MEWKRACGRLRVYEAASRKRSDDTERSETRREDNRPKLTEMLFEPRRAAPSAAAGCRSQAGYRPKQRLGLGGPERAHTVRGR
jgi:hypothetical protein